MAFYMQMNAICFPTYYANIYNTLSEKLFLYINTCQYQASPMIKNASRWKQGTLLIIMVIT